MIIKGAFSGCLECPLYTGLTVYLTGSTWSLSSVLLFLRDDSLLTLKNKHG